MILFYYLKFHLNSEIIAVSNKRGEGSAITSKFSLHRIFPRQNFFLKEHDGNLEIVCI